MSNLLYPKISGFKKDQLAEKITPDQKVREEDLIVSFTISFLQMSDQETNTELCH